MRNSVAEHYTHGSLLAMITAGIESIGKTPASVTIDELAPADEFHIGGRQASEEFADQLGLTGNEHVLDVGCGIGGTSRFIASRFGCRVTGVDLTPEFIETGTALCKWVGLDEQIELHQGNALSMPFTEGSFDAAIMLHVGMNIADKAGLFSEVYRLLRPGAVFGVYDVMKTGDGELKYPVPWSSVPDTCALATQAQYVAALQQAGFDIIEVENRREFAADFFDETRERMAAAEGTPPPLGVHIAMGESAPAKITNMVENIAAGCCAPVEIIARRT